LERFSPYPHPHPFFLKNLLICPFYKKKVIDVAAGLEAMVADDSTASETFELYGPRQYSMAEVAELVDKEVVKKHRHINLPKMVLKPLAGLLNRALWWPITSADEIEREFIDQEIDPAAKTFKDLDIEPAELTSLTYAYLVCLHYAHFLFFRFALLCAFFL
jgi:NADH dehydrogenase (ubiquinone) 1 alpha subcomplex subunit 9